MFKHLDNKWKILIFMLTIFFVLLQYKLWFDKEGIIEFFKLKKKLMSQQAINQSLQDNNQKIIEEIKRSQNSDEMIEEEARNTLGMIKKNEIFYQVIKKD